MNFLWIYYK